MPCNILSFPTPIFQWDSGLNIIVNGSLIVEEGTQYVHFQHKGQSAIYSVAVVDGQAAIPNIILQTAGAFEAYAYVNDASYGKTLVRSEFSILPRPMPPEYIYDPTPVITYPQLVELVEDLTALKSVLENVSATTETLPAGSDATASVTETESGLRFDFGIPGGAEPYELPIASADTLGGVKVGSNLAIDEDGVLTANVDISGKANLSGGNTFSGDQVISDDLTVNGKATINAIDAYSGKVASEPSANSDIANKKYVDDNKVAIDATLSEEGEAADAKATGDALAGKAVLTGDNAFYGDQTINGQVSASYGSFAGNVTMNSNKIVSLAAPTANGDAANKKYVDDSVSGVTPRTASATFFSNSWLDYNTHYKQSFSIVGETITANTKVDVEAPYAALNQMIADGTQALYIENNNGTLTAICIGSAPTANISVQLTLTEVQ